VIERREVFKVVETKRHHVSEAREAHRGENRREPAQGSKSRERDDYRCCYRVPERRVERRVEQIIQAL
jgi:hypothetical protein